MYIPILRPFFLLFFQFKLCNDTLKSLSSAPKAGTPSFICCSLPLPTRQPGPE